MVKVISIDIETAPMTVHNWSLWDNFTGLNQIIEDWYIISVAGVDENGETFYGDIKTLGNEKNVLRMAWAMLDAYDVIVGHNIEKFDLKKLNTRFLAYGFDPPSTYTTIDTLKVLKKTFSMSSNKLEYAVKHLGLEEKLTDRKYNGHALWTSCLIEGDEEAWKEMKDYNIQDAKITLDLYHKLRPWIKNHPTFNLIGAKDESEQYGCPRCGSDCLVKRGFYYTKSGKYQRYACKDCGGWCRSRYTEKVSKEMPVSV